MGNSNSQFKRSRSQYGSTRSVAFSLPSKWDSRNYGYNGRPHRSSSVSSDTHLTHPKPILRNSTNMNGNGVHYNRNGMGNKEKSQSLHSLRSQTRYEHNHPPHNGPLYDRHTPISSSQPQLSHKQFNDIYLKNDLKRLFKAQDRSHFVAHVDDGPQTTMYSSTMSLDRKLFALKSQRGVANKPAAPQPPEPKREGATEKRVRSRKAKQAPLPQNLPGAIPLPRVEGMFRKKRQAPQPPSKEKSRSMSSLTLPSESKASADISLLDEIKSELANKELNISIPKPDYDASSPRDRSSDHKKHKPKSPPTPIKVFNLVSDDKNNQDERMQTLTVVAVDVHKQPQHSPTIATIIPSAQPAQSVATEISEPSAKPTHLAVKKEYREIAIQYDAPVEIAIQCSGNTLKESKRDKDSELSRTSLNDLLQMFNNVIAIGEASLNKETEKRLDDSQSSCSETSSARSRNSANQQIVRLDEVLAGVPSPPPLPDSSVKLIHRKTIKENVPVTLALLSPPQSSEDSISQISATSDDLSPKKFSAFQEELVNVYEKFNKRRKSSNPPEYTKPERRESGASSDASVLQVFKHQEIIMGIQHQNIETGSDSGHDEPSEYGSSVSHGRHSKGIPDFVLDDIAKNLPTEMEWSFDQTFATSSPLHNDKSKFNSIKRIKKNMKKAFSSMSRSSSKNSLTHSLSVPDFDEPEVTYRDENWTLSGRKKASRSSVIGTDAFSSSTPEHKYAVKPLSKSEPTESNTKSESFTGSSVPFKQANMMSFSLLTPAGYHGETKTFQHVSNNAIAVSQPRIPTADESVADVSEALG